MTTALSADYRGCEVVVVRAVVLLQMVGMHRCAGHAHDIVTPLNVKMVLDVVYGIEVVVRKLD